LGVELERISTEGGGIIQLIIRYLLGGTEEFQTNSQTGNRRHTWNSNPAPPEQHYVALSLHDSDWSLDFKRMSRSVIPLSNLGLSNSSNRNYAQWLNFPEEAE